MEDAKKESNTINNMLDNNSSKDLNLSKDDPIEVNNLITLNDSDITPELLDQLEAKAKQEEELLEKEDPQETNEQKDDIQIPTGIPADQNGAVNITSEITEKPKDDVPIDAVEEAEMNAKYKKYVIYINKDNEQYLDELSLKERKELINQVLHEQKTISDEEKAERKKKARQTKLIISAITFFIAVPLIYFLINISVEATMQNYKQSRANFEVLYKNSGKIKINQYNQ